MSRKEFPVPVVTIGPGSQEGDDEQLSYIEMPKDMNTFSMPRLPEPGELRRAAGARAGMRWLRDAAREWRPGAANPAFDARVLEGIDREMVDQILGEGEVSIIVSGARETRAQESVFTGVWRIRILDDEGSVAVDLIEVGPIPAVVMEAARAASAAEVPTLEPPAGAFGAQPIIEEVSHKVVTRRAGDPAHVINLSLLPMTPADAGPLGQVLAAGPVRILSRGYGNPMVDSIEITDVPEVAVASPQDIEESAGRIGEALEWLERG